jgi:predicted DNA-binding protein
MELSSIRLPIELVQRADEHAAMHGMKRSAVIREALTVYLDNQPAPINRDDAVHALDVLRRAIDDRYPHAA